MKVKVHLTNRRLNYGGGKAARVSLRIYIQKSDHKKQKKKSIQTEHCKKLSALKGGRFIFEIQSTKSDLVFKLPTNRRRVKLRFEFRIAEVRQSAKGFDFI